MLNSVGTFILLLFCSLQLFPQNPDSLRTSFPNTTTYYFTAQQFGSDSATFVSNDLSGLHDYLPKHHLGNSGTPIAPLHFQLTESPSGFNYYKNHYAWYFFQPEKLKFFHTRVPYTDLFYITGSKIEQVFNMTFSYNLRKNWNIAANFYRIRSEGFYLRQNTNDNFIAVSTNYKSTRNKYYLLGGIIYNNARNSENGGVSDDSLFAASGAIDKKLVNVNLQSARRNVINRNIFLKQYFNLGKNLDDSLALIPASRFVLSSSVDDNYLKYEDDIPLSAFYSDVYYDSLKTFDSTYYYKIDNELVWERLDNRKRRGIADLIGLGFSVRDQLVRIRQREIDTVFNNITAGARLFNTYSSNRLWWQVSANYTITGYNQGDQLLSASIKKGLSDSLSFISLSAFSSTQEVDFIYHRYSSNHFKWENEMDKMQQSKLQLDFFLNRLKLFAGAGVGIYTNVPYFDNYAIARQYKGTIPVYSAYLQKDLGFRGWHLDNRISFQQVPDSMVIRLPDLVLRHSLYYESKLFKGAMLLQIGFSVFYNTAYYANRYMPATGQFYLQDDQKYGDYPVIDFFINTKIRQARIFFKIDHLNSGFMGNGYVLTPSYPLNDRAFKLGISWKFFD